MTSSSKVIKMELFWRFIELVDQRLVEKNENMRAVHRFATAGHFATGRVESILHAEKQRNHIWYRYTSLHV